MKNEKSKFSRLNFNIIPAFCQDILDFVFLNVKIEIMKKLSIIVWLFLCFLVFLSPASASSEFETAYQVRYQVSSKGITHVSQDVSLTNKLSNVYATQYSLTFQSTNITNIQAHDELGKIETKINQTEDLTLITLKLNQEVVGTGKTLTFNLSYNAPDLVSRTGQVWEITVPKLSNASEIDNYQLQLAIPTSFGTAAYISPNPVSTSQENNYQVYNFTKNQIAQAGVKAAFGQFQVFDFIFNYHLQNNSVISVVTEISLPPDTAFQKIYYQSLEPKPENVRVDEDGNWLAKYHLSGNQKLNIEAIGKVKVFSQPQKDFLLPSSTTLQENLGEQEYWPVYHSSIQAIATEMKSVKEIYNYVVSHLSYDFDRVEQGVERQGALSALEKPNESICMEFTDLFITLTRAIGIPAREINGYAYTTNPRLRPLDLVADVLHSWPEYWDDEKKIWLPVDPTWEKTTGGVDYFNKTDLNHFAFAIHGLDSQLPAPAGSYRAEENGGKNIQVSFGKFENIQESKLEVEFDLPKAIFAGLKTQGKIIVHNLGPTAIYDLPTQITGENIIVNPVNQDDQEVKVIPPFGKSQISLEISSKDWLKIGQGKINLSLDGQEYSQNFKIQSLIWQGILPLIGLCFVLAAASFFLFRLTVKKRSVTKEVGEL